MAERPTLLLVTANYPFVRSGGEINFLPPEVQALALSGRFQLRVLPLARSAEQLPLPAGASLDESLALALHAGRWADGLLAWRWPGFGAELRRALRSGGVVGVARVWRWAASARGTWRWLGRQQIQAPVLAYTYWRGGPSLALARWAAAGRGRVAVTRVHRYELYEDAFSPPFQPWVSVYRQLACTVTVSAHGRDHLLAQGVPPQRVTLARLGTPPAPGRSRASSDGTLRVLSCSFLRPEKRVPLLARAMVKLAETHPAQTFVWTHLGDGPERREVERALAGAPSNLQAVLAGPKRNAEVMAHYAQEPVDLFVQVSESEGLPVAIMEALSAGVPVVAADVGGVPEALDSAVGLLLPAHPDAAAVAEAIATLGFRLPPVRRQALRDAAYDRWAERFDAARNHAAFAGWLAAQAVPP